MRQVKRRRVDHDKENLERWLLTYSDLITLLLAFFVVMYSISKVDTNKYNEVSDALHTILRGEGPSTITKQAISIDYGPKETWTPVGDLRILQGMIRTKLDEVGFSKNISANIDQRGLVIRVSESAFFDIGSAELRPEAYRALDLISDFLLSIPNHVRIEGHTDNLPINTPKFPSNWELSVSRAAVCVRYLIEKHNFRPERISALGYGQYRPITGNDTPDGRRKNRRVDIIVLNWNERQKEPQSQPEDISGNAENYSLPELPDQASAE